MSLHGAVSGPISVCDTGVRGLYNHLMIVGAPSVSQQLDTDCNANWVPKKHDGEGHGGWSSYSIQTRTRYRTNKVSKQIN